MVRAGKHRKSVYLQRMMACVCCAALFVLSPGTASAERQADKTAFKGTPLSLKPSEERKKKRAAAQAYKSDPSKRVIIEPAAAVPGVDVVDGVQVPKDLSENASSDEGNVPGDLVEAQEDPLEGLNRVVFGFNVLIDHLIVEPSARIYHAVIPAPIRTGVTNVLNNL